MPAWRLVLALSLLALPLAACAPTTSPKASPSPSVSSSPRLDSCLVGKWALQGEDLKPTTNSPVTGSGLAGATLTVTKDGAFALDYDPSAPLLTTTTPPTSSTLRGTVHSTVESSNGTLSFTLVSSTATATNTSGGITTPPSPLQDNLMYPTMSYTCTATSLNLAAAMVPPATTSSITLAFMRS